MGLNINLINTSKITSASGIYEQSINKKDEAIQSNKNKKDEVKISDYGKDYQTVVNNLPNVPDVREEKVNSIKEQIDNGTYNLNPENIADKILGLK